MKIFFYYSGFLGTGSVLAGTNRMIFVVAKELAKDNDVTICGQRVEKTEVIGRLKIIKYECRDVIELIDGHDVLVISGNEEKMFIPVLEKQKIIRWQHCWLGDWSNAKMFEPSNVVIAVSNKHLENLCIAGVERNKIRVAYNCVDDSVFYQRNSVERNQRSVMYCGALTKNKGLHVLLDAIEMMTEEIVLNIYGNSSMVHADNSYESKMLARASKNIVFHGAVSQEELAIAYSSNSILCVPTFNESFGLVSVEAQSCGCIPVAHDVGGISETMDNLVSGFLYHPNTPISIADAISKAIYGAKRMRGAAMSFAKKFTKKNTIKMFTDVLSEL